MLVFRLAVLLAFLWNLSLFHCLVGAIQVSFVRTPTKPRAIVPNALMAQWKNTKAGTVALPSTSLGATSQPSEQPTELTTSTVAFVFPSTRERYRNLTRALEYSVVVDNDDEISYDRKFYERLATTPLEHFFQEPRQKSIDDASFATQENFQTAVGWPFSKKFAKRLAFLSLWWQWLVRKTITSRLSKQLQVLLRVFRKDGTSSKVSYYTKGTKRHYALLVACLVKGDIYQQPAALWQQNDPLAYHRVIVESAHRRTIASLSSSTLSLSNRANGRIRLSSLERHALQWALKNKQRGCARKQES